MVSLVTRIAAFTRRLLGRPAPAADAGSTRAPAALPPRATRALPPPGRPAWTRDAAYLHLARQLLAALGSSHGARNRVAATMTRALWDTRDPGVELQQLCDEAKTVLRMLGDLRVKQVTETQRASEAAELAPLQAIAQRSR
jgi:hypothetical protein